MAGMAGAMVSSVMPYSIPHHAPHCGHYGDGKLIAGRQVSIRGAGSGQFLGADPGSGALYAGGASGANSSEAWIPVPTRFVKLQSVQNPDKFLAIRDGRLTWGGGGMYTEFKMSWNGRLGGVNLKAIAGCPKGHAKFHVGCTPDGRAKDPAHCGTGEHATWRMIFLDRAGHHVPGSGEDYFRSFGHGMVAVFQLYANGKSLRICDNGTVEAKGTFGPWAQFFVHPTRQVRFRLASNPSRWLRVQPGGRGTDAAGGGGGWTPFRFADQAGGRTALEAFAATETAGSPVYLQLPGGAPDQVFDINPVE